MLHTHAVALTGWSKGMRGAEQAKQGCCLVMRRWSPGALVSRRQTLPLQVGISGWQPQWQPWCVGHAAMQAFYANISWASGIALAVPPLLY